MPKVNKQWQEFEDLVKEEKPELWAEFNREYEDPRFEEGSCSTCACLVTNRVQHRKWHRAISFRHFVLAAAAKEWLDGLAKMNELFDEVFSELDQEKP